MKIRSKLAAALGGIALAASLPAAAQSDEWKFSVMPYLWLPSVDGKLRYGPPPVNGGTANVDVSSSNVLDALDFAFMINGQAKKGRWLVATDVIYMDLSADKSQVQSVDFNFGQGPVNVSSSQVGGTANAGLKGWVWTLVGGYSVIEEKKGNLDIIAGTRMLNLEANTSWELNAVVTGNGPAGQTRTFTRVGSDTKSETLWAGIVGAKGRVAFGESPWFANYYVDVGGASSLFTWQGAAGVGYSFKWGDVVLDYRYLYYSQSGDEADRQPRLRRLRAGRQLPLLTGASRGRGCRITRPPRRSIATATTGSPRTGTRPGRASTAARRPASIYS